MSQSPTKALLGKSFLGSLFEEISTEIFLMMYPFLLVSDQKDTLKLLTNKIYLHIFIFSCENSNLLDTSIRNDADDVDCNDVRLMMGEDGFALGELSHPKALRFSIGDSTEQQTHQMIESITKPPTPLPNIMQSPGRIPIGKYAGFIQVISKFV